MSRCAPYSRTMVTQLQRQPTGCDGARKRSAGGGGFGTRGTEVAVPLLFRFFYCCAVCVFGAFGACSCGPAGAMSRLSRMQRQVLGLYRELLRAGRGKPGAQARVRAEFRQHACLPRSDVLRIEYLYRRGRRQLQLLRSGHATAMGAFVRPRSPPGGVKPPEIPPEDGDGPRTSLDGTGTPGTRPDRR